MKNRLPGVCPVCQKELTVTHMHCTHCDTHYEGQFYVNQFLKLDEKQLAFLQSFIKCHGNIKEMEKELGISYPTVKSRLDEIGGILGVEPVWDQQNGQKNVLEGIEKGEISVDEGIKMLKAQRKGVSS